MKIHELNVKSHRSSKRLGRGISAGQGKTAGRGTKGQNSRAGSKFKPGFEGGQTKLAQRLPKERGFNSLNRIEYQIVNLSQLDQLNAKVIDPEAMKKAGLIKNINKPVKLLSDGSISKQVKLTVHKTSEAAKKAIESAGGEIILIKKDKTKTIKSKEEKTK